MDEPLQKKQQEVELQVLYHQEEDTEQKKKTSVNELGSMQKNDTSELDAIQGRQEKTGLMEEVDKTEESMNTAFIMSRRNMVKTVRNEPEIKPEPKYVSLEKSFAIDGKNDSEKMQAVKDAISRYQVEKENNSSIQREVLETVINACDQYLKWKFSLFKFGKAADRLREVKEVRANARKELQKLKKAEAKLSPDEKKEQLKNRIALMKKDEKYYAPELNTIYQSRAESLNKENKAILKAKIKGLQFHYPAMDYDEAAKLVIRLEMTEGYELGDRLKNLDHDSETRNKLDKLVSDKALASAKEKRQKDADREERREAERKKESEKRSKMSPFELKLQRYNPVARIFMRTVGRMWVWDEVYKDMAMAVGMQSDMTEDEVRDFFDEHTSESKLYNEGTFI